jgi:hypothetical protein
MPTPWEGRGVLRKISKRDSENAARRIHARPTTKVGRFNEDHRYAALNARWRDALHNFAGRGFQIGIGQEIIARRSVRIFHQDKWIVSKVSPERCGQAFVHFR